MLNVECSMFPHRPQDFSFQLSEFQLFPPCLPLADALRIRTAEFRLRLGHADAASRELEQLSAPAARHPWAMRTQLTIVSALTFA